MSNVASTQLPFLATMLPVSATMSNEISYFRQSRNKLNIFNLFRLCRKDEILQQNRSTLLPFVAKKSNVASTKSNVASTLLLLWTGPYVCVNHVVNDSGYPAQCQKLNEITCFQKTQFNVLPCAIHSRVTSYQTLVGYEIIFNQLKCALVSCATGVCFEVRNRRDDYGSFLELLQYNCTVIHPSDMIRHLLLSSFIGSYARFD